MLFGIVVFLFVIVCILLCCLVLIQSDKGGGISGAIGGGLAGASSMFGTQDTANVLTKLTTGFAAAFMGLCIIMSLFLSHPSAKQSKSALKERAEKQQNFSPASALQGQQGLPLAPAAKPGQVAPAQGQSLPLQGAVAPAKAQQAPVQQQPAAAQKQQAPAGGLPILPSKAPEGKAK